MMASRGQWMAMAVAGLLVLRAALLPATVTVPLPIKKPPVDGVLIFPGPSHPRGAKPQITTFPISRGNLQYNGSAWRGEDREERILWMHRSWARFPVEMDYGPFLSPVCKVGMIIPVCGRVGKIIAVDNDVRVQLLPDDQLPEGVELPGEAPTLMVGGTRGHPEKCSLKISRLGRNEAGELSVDLKLGWRKLLPNRPDQQAEQHNLTVGSRFTLEEVDWQGDYEIASIIPPDEKQHVVGWITLKQVVGTFRWREHKRRLSPLPATITVPQLREPEGRKEYHHLPTFRSDIDFLGDALTADPKEPPRVQIVLVQQIYLRPVEEEWEYQSPRCAPGLLFPVCGQVGRVERVGEDVVFKMVAEADLPMGVSFPGENLPVVLGAGGDLRLERIGLDETGALSADITQEWRVSYLKDAERKSETLTGLKVGSVFTRRHSWVTCDYRVTQIIAPDGPHHVPGWIGLRPVPGTRIWERLREAGGG